VTALVEAPVKPFLIVDEAERMSGALLDLVRDVAQDSRTPICLVGQPEVIATLARVPATHHRIGFRYKMQEVLLADYSATLMGESTETIQAIYLETQGNLRHLDRVLALLADDNLKGKTITPTIVKALAQQFMYRPDSPRLAATTRRSARQVA
jgi:DNA transposition AAA+ family ATPase